MKTKKTAIDLDLQIATKITDLPSPKQFQTWLTAALKNRSQKNQVTIRIVDEAEIAKLNKTYRHKSGPTNILSFNFEAPTAVATPLLGDLIICAPIVIKEAAAQNKSSLAHWAHLTVHGALHLLGYDHINPKDATIMEPLEIQILAELGFSNPYE